MSRNASNDAARACRGKCRHASENAARIALRETMRETGDLSLVYYYCRHCGGFHVGHPSGRDLRRRLKFDRLIHLIEHANQPPKGKTHE